MTVERELPTAEAQDLIGLTRDLVAAEVAPRAASDEEAERFPREVFATLGGAGLLGLPYPQEHGGGGQPYEVYLQVIEELAAGWLAVGLGVSVHTLSCFPIAAYGSAEQRARLLPEMVGGGLLGAYCLSEPGSGSDAAAMTTKAVRHADSYEISGTKAWITHGGVADYYAVFARMSGAAGAKETVGEEPRGARGVSCFHVPGPTAGVAAAPAENKMGMRASTTTQVSFDGALVPADHLIGGEGKGFRIAMAALDGGRL